MVRLGASMYGEASTGVIPLVDRQVFLTLFDAEPRSSRHQPSQFATIEALGRECMRGQSDTGEQDDEQALEVSIQLVANPEAPSSLVDDEFRAILGLLKDSGTVDTEPTIVSQATQAGSKGVGADVGTIMLSLSSGMVPTLIKLLVDWRREKDRAASTVQIGSLGQPLVLSPEVLEAAIAAGVFVEGTD